MVSLSARFVASSKKSFRHFQMLSVGSVDGDALDAFTGFFTYGARRTLTEFEAVRNVGEVTNS
jgi:hypothetical protein